MTHPMAARAGSSSPKESRAYAAYRFRADIDWIELRIVTSRPSNHDTVTTRVGVDFAEPVNAGPGQAATEFILTFQDPQSWQQLEESLQRFTHDHPLVEPVQVAGIEVAMDAYSRTQTRQELADMTYRFYKSACRLVSTYRRIRRTKRDKLSPEEAAYRPKHFDDGYNLYVGKKIDDVQQHLYLKQTTQKAKVIVGLPQSEHRARTEITLKKRGLPVTMFEEWKHYDLTRLASFFKYRKLKPNLSPFVKCAMENLDQIGEARPRRRKNRSHRMYSPSTVADRELNALTYSALRELNRRMKG